MKPKDLSERFHGMLLAMASVGHGLACSASVSKWNTWPDKEGVEMDDHSSMSLEVAIEDRARFSRTALKWHLLVECIGWNMLCELMVDARPPFDTQDIRDLFSDDEMPRDFKIKVAKEALIGSMAQDLRNSGLKVSKTPQRDEGESSGLKQISIFVRGNDRSKDGEFLSYLDDISEGKLQPFKISLVSDEETWKVARYIKSRRMDVICVDGENLWHLDPRVIGAREI